MKQQFKTVLAVILFTMIGSVVFCQEEKPEVPKWHSEKGYWVVESNIHTPMDHIIRFYNNDNVLLYKEAVSGIKLDPSKRKTKMKLKKILESSVDTWQQAKVMEENKDYVAKSLKK